MEPSSDAEAILKLGRKLVRELELDDTCETLSKWMAHYLAAQMSEAESAQTPRQKRAAQSRCCELILRIWEQRSSLPDRVRPLGRIEEALKTLIVLQSDPHGVARLFGSELPSGANAWFDYTAKVSEIDRHLIRVALLTGLLEYDFESEKQWVAEHGDVLSVNEQKLIQALDDWLNLKSHFVAADDDKSVGDLPPAERADLVLKELDIISKKHRRMFHDLKKRLSKQPKYRGT